MEKYQIVKVFGNNVVLVDYKDCNYILVGSGIGFGKKKGDVIEENSKIDLRFISLEGLDSNDYNRFINQLDTNVIEAIEKIIDMISKKHKKTLNPNIYAGLIDHIQFTVKRIKDGVLIVNPFLNEIKLLYPEEFQIAKKAVKLLSKELDMGIPEDEVGFLTFHIYGGLYEDSKSKAFATTRIMNEIVNYTRTKLGLKIYPSSFEYTRFLIHLKGIMTRVQKNTIVKNPLLTEIKTNNIIEYTIAFKIGKMLENHLNCKVSEDEIGYIAIHLMKLNNTTDAK